MDEIINKLIDIDNTAKSIISEVENKKENLDDLIEERLRKGKDMIDSKFSTKLRFKENELKDRLEKEKEKIDVNLKIELDKLEEEYRLKKNIKIGNMIKNSGFEI